MISAVGNSPLILCLPDDDFRRLDKPSGTSFRETLRGCEYSIWATSPRKVHRKDVPDGLSSLWLPNEDLGMSKNMCSRAFVSTFHTLDYSIWAKCDESSYKKSYPQIFDIPKSSFGEHKFWTNLHFGEFDKCLNHEVWF
jgi:hypothetical protein